MKVAVFGGCGFLGIYLVSELINSGHEVTIFDILPYKEPNQEAKSVILDITYREKVIELLVEGKFNTVFNLAGFANLDNAIKDPHRAMELNVLGNINILDGCIQSNVNRFIYASSAYAMSEKGSFYGISKLTSEKIIEEYFSRFGLAYTILRYGSVYSELAYENNYIYNLIENAIKTGKIEHGGDGSEIREYIHASDAAKLSVYVMENDLFKNEHVIFTGTEKMKRHELFELINEILGNRLEIVLNKGEYLGHYKLTPYSYSPTLSRKLVSNHHIDMGQGIVECIKAVYLNNPEFEDEIR